MKNRVCYSEIKRCIFDSLYLSCRTKGYVNGWTHNQVLSAVYDSFCYRGESYQGDLNDGMGAFDHPVEYFMLETIFLTLSGNWYPEQSAYYLKEITKIMKFHTLDSMMSDLPDDELREFKYDLKELGLIEKYRIRTNKISECFKSTRSSNSLRKS